MAFSLRPIVPSTPSLSLYAAVGAVALAVGTLIAVAATDSLVVLAAFAALCTAIIVFAMPKPKTVTDKAVWPLLLIFFVFLCLYPSYVPIRLPGLPWINPTRIVGVVMLFALIYMMVAGREVQAELKARIRAQPFYFFCFFGFLGASLLSLPTADQLSLALGRFSIFQLYWTFFFLAAFLTLTTERRIETLLRTILIMLAIQAALGIVESYREKSLWATILPANFGSDIEYFQRVIQGVFRFGVLRVQNSFSTSLLYAEFLVLLLPFVLHIAFYAKRRTYRIFAALVALAVLPAQYASGSRLGTVGVIVVFGVLTGLVALRIHRSGRKTLLVPIVLVLGLTLALLAVSAFLASPRIQTRILGGHEHSASNAGRLEQFQLGIPMSLKRPLFGYGIGTGGEALNYSNLAGIESIDSFILSIVLDVGYVGALFFWGMIFWSLWSSAQMFLRGDTRAGKLGAAIAASLSAFIFIKIVLAQVDNLPLTFLIMALNLRVLDLDATERAAKQMIEARPAAPCYGQPLRQRPPTRLNGGGRVALRRSSPKLH